MKVIKHGYNGYSTQCLKCRCLFEYELKDIDAQNNVTCPDCGNKTMHRSCDYQTNSQIGDKK